MNPETVHELFEKRFNAGDTEGVVALYEPDAVVINRDGTVQQGAAAIRVNLLAMPSPWPRVEVRPVRTIHAGDVAVLITDWKMTGAGPDGDEGRTYDVVRRQPDGTWLCVVDNPYGITP